MEFMEANLPGVVSFQAIAKLRKKWNAPLPEDSAKLRSGALMHGRLCLLPRSSLAAGSANLHAPGSGSDCANDGTGVHPLADSSKYSSVKLCAFCYQFFYDSP
jgi:hypothetical protein